MAEIMINDEMFFSGEREPSAVEMNFIKNNHGVYYNSMEGAVYILDHLADSLTDELAVILFISRDSILMTFANNPESVKASVIEFRISKNTEKRDFNRVRLALMRYCMIYSVDNSFKVVQLNRQTRPVKLLLDKIGLKYEIIDQSHLDFAISKLLKSYSVFEKVKRIGLALSLASLSITLGIFINSYISDYFDDIDRKIKINAQTVRSYRTKVTLNTQRYNETLKKYNKLKDITHVPNTKILHEFYANFTNGNLLIQDFKIVQFIKESEKKKKGAK